MPALRPQLKRLIDALVGSLGERNDIWLFLYYHLGLELNDITPDAERLFMITRIVKAALQGAWLDQLIEAAVTAYPKVEEFAAIRRELLPLSIGGAAPPNPWGVCIFRGGRPFIDREELRRAVKELEDDDGPRILVVQGDEAGKSYSRQYVTHRAEARGERIAWIDLVQLQQAMPPQTRITPEDLARSLCDETGLERTLVGPKEDEQYARWNMAFCSRLSSQLLNAPERWWIIVDEFNNVLLPDATLDLIKQLASKVDAKMPIARLVLLGYDAQLPVEVSATAQKDRTARISDLHLGDFFTWIYTVRGKPFTQSDIVASTAKVLAAVALNDPRPNQTIGQVAGAEARRLLHE